MKTFINVMDYATIASSVGNALILVIQVLLKGSIGTTSSSTRGILLGGRTPSSVNVIEYITIGSTGNTTDFGDLLDVTSTNTGATASSQLEL